MPLIYYPISALISTLVYIIMIIFVGFHGRTRLHRLYLLMTGYAALWSFFYFLWQIAPNAELALIWCRGLTFGSIFIPVGFAHFTIYWLGDEKKYKKQLIYFYASSALFFVFNFTPLMVREVVPIPPFPYWPKPGILYHFSLAHFMGIFLFSFYVLARHIRSSRGIKRAQAKIMLAGIMVASIGGSTNFFLWYDIPIHPIGNIFSLTYTLTGAYIIVKHRFMDLKMVLRKSFVFLSSVLTVLAAAMSVNYFIRQYSPSVWYWVNTGMLILILYIFPVLRKYYYKLANKYFFSSLYDPQEIIAQLGNKLRYILDVKKIYKYLAEVFVTYIRLKSFGYFSYDAKTQAFISHYNNGLKFKEQYTLAGFDGDIINNITSKTVFLLDELRDSDYARYKSLIESLEAIGAKSFVVLSTKYKPVGILVLGAKESNDNFSEEDVQTLEIISGLVASAMENARLYQETKKKSDDLESLLKMKSGFLRVINHQLNTPVSIMRLSFSSIRDKSQPVSKGLDMAEAGLERISNTLNDFWLAYEFEGASVEMTNSKVDIYKLLKKLIAEKKGMSTVVEKKLELILRKPGFETHQIGCDGKLIKHAISNIIDNAIVYTPKGKVIISLDQVDRAEGRFLKISISDTGKGISDKDKKILFEKFARGSIALLSNPDGSGLGLYIAKRITEESGGELRLEHTELGQGTTFSISLPYKPVGISKDNISRPIMQPATAAIITEMKKK
jgi:signal transduction histidine kinase